MKTNLRMLAVLSLVLMHGGAFTLKANDIKIGFVNLQRALETVDAGKKAKQKLESTQAAKKIELEKAQAKLQQEAEEFEKKAAIMNERSKVQRQQELQKKFVEFQKTMGQTQMEMQQLERELSQPIIKNLRAIVEVMGKERKFTLILEKSESAVLFSSGGEDLTEELIKRFNSSYKKKKG